MSATEIGFTSPREGGEKRICSCISFLNVIEIGGKKKHLPTCLSVKKNARKKKKRRLGDFLAFLFTKEKKKKKKEKEKVVRVIEELMARNV